MTYRKLAGLTFHIVLLLVYTAVVLTEARVRRLRRRAARRWAQWAA